LALSKSMKSLRSIDPVKAVVALAAGVLFPGWLVLHAGDVAADQNGLIRLVLSLLFAFLILVRSRPDAEDRQPGEETVATIGVLGAAMVVGGIVLSVGQVEWLGLLLLLYGCLRWSLPERHSRNVPLALLVAYWAHPLPGQVFGAFQLAMQRMSVVGAEWLLHMLNVRVWADGLVLRTGISTFDVPASCSGMRTATTVFLLALGLVILKRLKPHECVPAVLAAVIQALVLNVVRISCMVIFAPKAGDGSGADFLHDTAGWIVITGVGLVYVELLLLDRHKRRRAALAETPDAREVWQLSEYPPFWRWVIMHRTGIILGLLGAVLAAGLIFKSRDYHRAQMYKDVATLLRDSGAVEDGERLAKTVCELVPDDIDWLFEMLRMLVIRGKFEEVVERLDQGSWTEPGRAAEASVLKAYSLMGLDRLDEAGSIVDGLPEEVKSGDPRVAMILAEMGYRAGDVEKTAASVVSASRWLPNTGRVRALYPFLRHHRRWRAITKSDAKMSYREAGQAMSAAEAYMNLNRTPVVADLALNGMTAWPDDPRVLEPLFYMALRRGAGLWEDRFAAHLGRSVRVMTDIDALARLFPKCAALSRPDLVWIVYKRVAELDERHPALYMCMARYGDRWFTFRKRHLGMGAASSRETVDLDGMYLLAGALGHWRGMCERVPHGAELALAGRGAIRKRFLGLALDEFGKRDRAGLLSDAMWYEYVRAMEMAGDVKGALEQAERIASENPALADRSRLLLSAILERQGDWGSVYEVLRGYENEPRPRLQAILRLCAAETKLKLSVASMFTARKAMASFPESSLAAAMLGRTLLNGNMPEDALQLLASHRARRHRFLDIMEVGGLYMTQRYAEMREYCKARLLPEMPVSDRTQALVLPPAELAAMWQRTSIPSEQDFAYNARALKKKVGRLKSPFLRKMGEEWLRYFEGEDEDEDEDENERVGRWLAVGRDRVEKAIALNQLTLLLCREKRFVEARDVAGRAVKLLPESAVLWRILIGLSGGDAEVVKAAREACPSDSEIWLAEVVVRTQRGKGQGYRLGPGFGGQARAEDGKEPRWVVEMVKESVREGIVTPAAMVRAGDYLIRGGMHEAGMIAARDGVRRARRLVPAYVLGLRCALEVKDRAWALSCTQKAIESMIEPAPFLQEMLVRLKSSRGMIEADGDMVQALKSLRRRFPDDPRWAEMSGYVRFKRGGWEVVEAMYEMMAAVEAGSTNRIPYLVAAEAARRSGNTDRAVEMLRKGLERHPDDLAMVNNLALVLAHVETGRAEAETLAEVLLKRASDNPDVLDTVAVVYLRSGKADRAEEVLSRLLELVQGGTPLWFRGKMHLAEIALARKERNKAKSILELIMGRSRGIPNEDIVAANRLLERCRE